MILLLVMGFIVGLALGLWLGITQSQRHEEKERKEDVDQEERNEAVDQAKARFFNSICDSIKLESDAWRVDGNTMCYYYDSATSFGKKQSKYFRDSLAITLNMMLLTATVRDLKDSNVVIKTDIPIEFSGLIRKAFEQKRYGNMAEAFNDVLVKHEHVNGR